MPRRSVDEVRVVPHALCERAAGMGCHRRGGCLHAWSGAASSVPSAQGQVAAMPSWGWPPARRLSYKLFNVLEKALRAGTL